MRLPLVLLCLPLTACLVDRFQLGPAVEGTDWFATSIAGTGVVNGTKLTLTIKNGRVGGKAGCNTYAGPVETYDSQLKFGALISTKMACVGNGVMEQESRYLSVLQAVTRGELKSGGLLLTGDRGSIQFAHE